MNYTAAQCSLQGGRAYNEDTICCLPAGKGLIALVADGLGGHGGGGDASAAAAESVVTAFVKRPQVEEAFLTALIKDANRAVLQQQTPEVLMKSTLAAFFSDGSNWASVHVGDSRLYHFHNCCLRFQTTDHSVSQMAVLAGEITKNQIRGHADRNKLVRALGGDKDVAPEITIFDAPLSADDAVLLCTDGFWELILEEEMAFELSKASTPEQWLNGMLMRIGGRMGERSDNLSAVALFFYSSEMD